MGNKRGTILILSWDNNLSLKPEIKNSFTVNILIRLLYILFTGPLDLSPVHCRGSRVLNLTAVIIINRSSSSPSCAESRCVREKKNKIRLESRACPWPIATHGPLMFICVCDFFFSYTGI